MYSFEKPDVWQKGVQFVNDIYIVTHKFPKAEMFGLVSQIRRAAVSIIANIAEGSSRYSKKDFSRFIEIAFGSLCEVIAELKIALTQKFVNQDTFDKLYASSEELSKMLSGLRNSLDRKL